MSLKNSQFKKERNLNSSDLLKVGAPKHAENAICEKARRATSALATKSTTEFPQAMTVIPIISSDKL